LKALIIGAAGFVGGHLIEYLHEIEGVEVFATKLSGKTISTKSIKEHNIFNLDILEAAQVNSLIGNIGPDYVFHLAAQSSVSLSWKKPALTYNINIIGVVNLLEAVKLLNKKTRVLLIGSAEEYGKVSPEQLPISEEIPLKPENPYAVSKAAQEMTADIYVRAFGLDIIMVRAFNHIGIRQAPMFVISDFAKQIAEMEKGLREPVMHVGNLDVKRDFTDVRDIVRGYWMLAKSGKSGQVYNIGSGKSISIRELLNKMINMSSSRITVEVDTAKLRPVDIPELKADISKIMKDVSWKPEIDIDTSLKDILDYWRKNV